MIFFLRLPFGFHARRLFLQVGDALFNLVQARL